MRHPCLKWKRGDVVEYYDLRSGWKVRVVVMENPCAEVSLEPRVVVAPQAMADAAETAEAIRVGQDIANQIADLTGLEVRVRKIK